MTNPSESLLTGWAQLPEEEFEDKITNLEQSFQILNNYRLWGVPSRSFLLEHEEKIAETVWRNQGESQGIKQSRFVKARLYLSLVDRTCKLGEDIACLFNALDGPLGEIPKSFLDGPQKPPDPEEMGPNQWRRILRYAPLEELPIADSECDFLSHTRTKNIDYISKRLSFLREFLDLHWLPYIRHKHAHSLVYGLESETVEGEEFILVPATYNPSSPDESHGIAITYRYYRAWVNLFRSSCQLAISLTERAIEHFERRFLAFSEYDILAPISTIEARRLNSLTKKCARDFEGTNIDVVLKSEGSDEIIERFEDLYSNFSDTAGADFPETG